MTTLSASYERVVVIARLLLLTAFVVLLVVQEPTAQLTYSSGQSVSPSFEGWWQNDDGTYTLFFGYMNSNWEEELNVPIGPDNNIEPAGPDQGQPTHFLPRRNLFVFEVRVPMILAIRKLYGLSRRTDKQSVRTRHSGLTI